MSQEPTPAPEPDHLAEIAAHLKSIRSMLTFFTIILILTIIVQLLNFFTRF